MKSVFTLSLFSLILITSCAQNSGEETNDNEGVTTSSSQTEQDIIDASVVQFSEGIEANQDALILDVRTPEEFAEGHIKGAINVDYYEDDFAQNASSQLDKNKEVYVYCKAGGRSASSCKVLQDMGYKRLINLEHGFDAWKEANKEIQK